MVVGALQKPRGIKSTILLLGIFGGDVYEHACVDFICFDTLVDLLSVLTIMVEIYCVISNKKPLTVTHECIKPVSKKQC